MEFIAQIYKSLLPHVDSIGLNEQELAAFVIANNGTLGSHVLVSADSALQAHTPRQYQSTDWTRSALI